MRGVRMYLSTVSSIINKDDKIILEIRYANVCKQIEITKEQQQQIYECVRKFDNRKIDLNKQREALTKVIAKLQEIEEEYEREYEKEFSSIVGEVIKPQDDSTMDDLVKQLEN